MKRLPLQHQPYRQLIEDFKRWLKLLGYAESTLKDLPARLREFLHYLEKETLMAVQGVEKRHVQGFFAHLSGRKSLRCGGSLSEGYIAKYWQALKLLDRYLRSTGQWGLTLPPASIQPERVIKELLTESEIKALYTVCEPTPLGARDRAMLSLFYGCGLRCSEGVGLDTSDILWEKRLLYVRKGKNYTQRYVPLSAPILADLKHYVQHSRPLLLAGKPTEALLLSQKGRRINQQSLSLRLRRLQRLTEDETLMSKPLSLHLLRHAIGTHLLGKGMRLARIARFLGHKSIKTTQLYTQLSRKEQSHDF